MINHLKMVRKSKKVTQVGLAEIMDWNHRDVSKVEVLFLLTHILDVGGFGIIGRSRQALDDADGHFFHGGLLERLLRDLLNRPGGLRHTDQSDGITSW